MSNSMLYMFVHIWAQGTSKRIKQSAAIQGNSILAPSIDCFSSGGSCYVDVGLLCLRLRV